MPDIKIEIDRRRKEISQKQLDIIRRVSNVLQEHGFRVGIRWRRPKGENNGYLPREIIIDLG